MYIILNKVNGKSAIIKDKTNIAGYLNVSISTVNRNLRSNKWETDSFIVMEADFVQIKSNRGGKRDKNIRNDMF